MSFFLFQCFSFVVPFLVFCCVICLLHDYTFEFQFILNSVSCLLFRYKVGQRFGQHIDESVDLGEGKRTHYTLLIYLSGGSKEKTKGVQSNVGDSSSEPLVGGETVFYGSRNGIVAEVNPLSFLPTSLAIILHFVVVFFLSFFFDNNFFFLILSVLH